MKRWFLVQNMKTLAVRVTSLGENMRVGDTYRERGARWRVVEVAQDSAGNRLHPAFDGKGRRVMVTIPE